MKIVNLSKPMGNNSPDLLSMTKMKNKPDRRATWLVRFWGLPFRLLPEDFGGWGDDATQNTGVHSSARPGNETRHSSAQLNGEGSKTTGAIPLEWCFGKGIVIDMKHKADLDPITVADIEDFLSNNKLNLRPGMIVLIRTGRDVFNRTENVHDKAAGVSAEVTKWLLDKGIRVMGIDCLGWNLSMPYVSDKAAEAEGQEYFWEANLVSNGGEYCHMERLTNLDVLPFQGFSVAVLPQKTAGASIAPPRVVALVD